MGKHYGAEIIAKVLELRKAGGTYREIGEVYERGSEQIGELIRGYQRNEAKHAAGDAPTARSPRSRNLLCR